MSSRLTCSFHSEAEGQCRRPTEARNLCNTHYQRLKAQVRRELIGGGALTAEAAAWVAAAPAKPHSGRTISDLAMEHLRRAREMYADEPDDE